MQTISVADLQAKVGTQVGVSRWFEITQAQIDAFADITEDWQYIHIDPERAAQTPFGGTIAHGFLTVSMLSAMFYDALPEIQGSEMGVNYGFDKLRFLAPVRAGARIRGVFKLHDLRQARPREITNVWDVTVEIDGGDRPALMARWIGRDYLKDEG